MQIKYRFGILWVPIVVLSITFLLLAGADAIQAQVSDPDWSQPIQLSSADADTDSTSQPAVIADRYGIVHAFWSERSLLNNQTSLMHAQFDGLSWSNPIAIVTNYGLIFFPRVSSGSIQRYPSYMGNFSGRSGLLFKSPCPAGRR